MKKSLNRASLALKTLLQELKLRMAIEAKSVSGSSLENVGHCLSAVKVLLAGPYQNGKSTLINCLLGGDYAIEGDGCHTTAYKTVYKYSKGITAYYKVYVNGKRELLSNGLAQTIRRHGVNVHFEALVSSPVLKNMSLIDAPGWGAEDDDDKQAEAALDDVKYVVYLAQKQLTQEDKKFLRLLKERQIYFCVVLNALHGEDPQSELLQNVCKAIYGDLKQLGVEGQFIKYPSAAKHGICVVNLLWAKFGRKLLDAPLSDRAKRQVHTVCMANGWRDDALDEVDYEGVLRDSGLQSWNLFLECSLDVIAKMGAPINCAIHEAVSSSICSKIIDVLKRM